MVSMTRRLNRNEEEKRRNVLPQPSSKPKTTFNVPYLFYLVLFIVLLAHAVFYNTQYRHMEGYLTDDTLQRPKISDIQLFVPSFPGGFGELNETALRTLQFFWPKNELDVVVILDDTVYEDNATKETMDHKVLSFFKDRDRFKNITVAYNPRSNKALYGKGWHIQQLIMLWADNFTDAPYIGFFDDDTVFTKAVNVDDLFDDQGRPRTIVKYPHGVIKQDYVRRWYQAHFWAFGGNSNSNNNRSYVNAMTYFPVVIKREHLASVREAILNAHPEFNCFDHFFMELKNRHHPFSQFGMMFDHIWQNHREEYSWHFEPYGWGIGSDDYDYVSPGSPEENGVTEEMRRPVPRIAMHFNYWKVTRNVRDEGSRADFVSKIMKQGYCFSLPLVSYALNEQTADKTCHGYDIWSDMNINLEWAFEDTNFGLIWPKHYPNGTLEAHRQRILKNRPHQWDQDELTRISSLPCEVL